MGCDVAGLTVVRIHAPRVETTWVNASLLLLLVGIAVTGCRESDEQPQANPAAIPEVVAKSEAEDIHDIQGPGLSEGSGTIKGWVRFTGKTIFSSTMVPVGTDPQYCGNEHSKEDYVIDPVSRGIRYVIVRLTDRRLNDWPHTKPGYLFLDNKNCRFEPHAAVLTVGSTLEMHNSDTVLHTVHAYFAASFNLSLPQENVKLKQVLRERGLIQLRCDTHGWMNAFIRVDRHPFHAVTDAQGSFEIPDVPSGTYTLEAWHEQFGTQRTEVVVRDHQLLEVDLTYSDE